MRKPFTPEQKQRIRKRHRGYACLLIVVAVAVLVQPLALNWPLLTSMTSIIMATVMLLFLTRNSALKVHRGWLYSLGMSAILFEVIWLVGMEIFPSLANHLTLIHLVIWALFIGAMDPTYLPAGIDPATEPLRVFPSMVCASFEALTTLSNAVSRAGELGGRICCLAISILGQLSVAMLIGLILGRFHQTMRR